MAAEALPPFSLGVPIRRRHQWINRMVKTAPDEFDVGAAETGNDLLNVNDITKSLPHPGIFQLLEQRPRETHVQARDVFVALDHARCAVVTPKNLACRPTLAGIVQRDEIAWRLVEVKTEGVEDVGHGRALQAKS